MPRKSINRLLDSLDEARRRFDKRAAAELARILRQLASLEFDEAGPLIRFHEALLFLRAHPPNRTVLHLVEKSLKTFATRIAKLREADADLSPLDDPEVSGIAGTSVSSNFSFEIVRWLVRKHPAQIAIDWDWFDDADRLGVVMSRFMPLLEEDATVEATVPYRDWIRAARGRTKDLQWLVARFEGLNVPDKTKAELYDSLKLHVRWTPSFKATRTGMKLSVGNIFFHDQPLISRRDVSIVAELQSGRLPIAKLSALQGERVLDLARETSAARYRELHGFTYGDPRRVLHAHIGRGVDLFFNGVPPERRLPLRAYHSAMIFKNGVPVGYFEGISLGERMEGGFNFYYTFREGETAWIYARVLRVCNQLLGVTAFSIDPYQIGYENEEGIESGAFWFYRKLGFRSVRPELLKLTLAEEKKIASRSNYRTTAKTLRKLAEGPMIFEQDESPDNSTVGDWDRFAVRNIGLAAARRMGSNFDSDAQKFRSAVVKELTRVLGKRTESWRNAELTALSDFAVALSLVEDLVDWSDAEKRALAGVVRAKAGLDETRYLKLMQKHERLRTAMIKLGSQ